MTKTRAEEATSSTLLAPHADIELSDEDILDAMRHISGYLDISTEDFRVIYRLAWRHAVERLRARDAVNEA